MTRTYDWVQGMYMDEDVWIDDSDDYYTDYHGEHSHQCRDCLQDFDCVGELDHVNEFCVDFDDSGGICPECYSEHCAFDDAARAEAMI